MKTLTSPFDRAGTTVPAVRRAYPTFEALKEEWDTAGQPLSITLCDTKTKKAQAHAIILWNTQPGETLRLGKWWNHTDVDYGNHGRLGLCKHFAISDGTVRDVLEALCDGDDPEFDYHNSSRGRVYHRRTQEERDKASAAVRMDYARRVGVALRAAGLAPGVNPYNATFTFDVNEIKTILNALHAVVPATLPAGYDDSDEG